MGDRSVSRLLLGGGGSAEDERAVIERFASWVGTSGAVLYLPVALGGPGSDYGPCLDWALSALNPLGVGRIDMWTNLADHDPAGVAAYAGIFIGGGNTFNLLHRLRSTGFGKAIVDFAGRGGVVYGGSAGAIVMGRDVSTCAHVDDNEAGITDTSGLDLVHGHAVWCHHTPEDEALVRAWVERTGSPVIALPETAGVWVQGMDAYVPLGTGRVYRFAAGGERSLLRPG